MHRLSIPLAAFACTADPTLAASAAASVESADPIVVTGEHVSYGVQATTTATKTPTDLKNLPQALSSNVGLRLNGLFEDSSTYRHHVVVKRYGINPTVALLAGPDTRIDLSYEHFHDRRTADRGVPANGDEPLRGYTRTFFGDPDKSFARANLDVATLPV